MSAIPKASRGRRFAVAFAAAAVVLLALDAAWLTTMAGRLYRPALGSLMRSDFDPLAAAAFYAIYLMGLVVFAVEPALNARSALARGAFFGFVCYATYDLTNQATLAGWPWHVTLADLGWGALLSAASAWASHRAVAFARR
jgi:uncharacterized membrane protein